MTPSPDAYGSQPSAPPPPPQVVVQQTPTAFGRYGRYLWLALGLAVMTIVGQASSYRSYFSPPNAPQEKYHSRSETSREKIAIISVNGAILEGDGFVKRQIDRVRDDDDVVAVVARIDSPGGTVTGSDYLLHHLRQMCQERKLPLVVSMGGICASGGYYIAMAVGDAEDVIFAEPATWTGSIGVVIPHYDVSGLLARWDVRDDSVVSHEDKLMGSPTRSLDPAQRAEERELLQKLVDISFERFLEIVKGGRPQLAQDAEKLQQATTGQIFTADQALALGLVDRIGFVEDAVARAAELAGRDPETIRCVQYEQPLPALSRLLTGEAPRRLGVGAQATFDLGTLLELTAPRAYYLCTWLPHLLAPRP
jgi:protease-4